ncbi:MAG: TonB family protein [Deltaproteobacteria bacterium]|nr:TonB family protein [Deltaproteobacteria bacterium]
MFDTLAGRSDAPKPKRFSAFSFALGAHVVILGAALFVTLKPAEPQGPEVVPPVVVYVKPVGVGDNKGHKGEETIRKVERDNKRPPKRHEIPVKPAEINEAFKPVETAAAETTPTSNVGEQAGTDSSGPGNSDGPGNGNGLGDGPDGSFETALPETVLYLGSDMTTPHPDATCVPPHPLAPYAASQMGIEGKVIARYVVHADGRADSLQVLNADAPTIFVDAVRAFLERCHFTASQSKGQPVSVKMSQTFRFDHAH